MKKISDIEKLHLFNKPTPIIKLNSISNMFNKNIYMKRDDLTGIELSGNKVRKLEYALFEATRYEAKVIITCGALQSNHARATAVACRMLGFEPHLILRGEVPNHFNGNLLIDKILDCKIDYLSNAEFSNINNILLQVKEEYEQKGIKAYIIPIGASNGIGNFGYWSAYNEILLQEKEMNIEFSTIITTIGSGGTFSGINLGNYFNKSKHQIVGYSVGGSKEYFTSVCQHIIEETLILINEKESLAKLIESINLNIVDLYQGEGYALPYKEALETIKTVAKLEGIILDPVYTGKCFHGLLSDLKLGKYNEVDNILFIHTGGHFGIESFSNLF